MRTRRSARRATVFRTPVNLPDILRRGMFAAIFAASKATSQRVRSGHAKTVYYASVGPALTRYDLDVDGAGLTARETVTLPANIQYAWPHPSRRFLYVVSSSGGPGIAGDKHYASALAIDAATGALRPAWRAGGIAVAPDPRQRRRQRPISADGLQHAEQPHRSPDRSRRADRRAGGAARQSRHRHLRPSNPRRAGQPHRDAGHARQQCRRRAT